MGKKVYSTDASFLGEVVDLGLTIGVVEPSLIVRKDQGALAFELPWDKVAFVKDIILTKEGFDFSTCKQIQLGQPAQKAAQPVQQQQGGESITKFCTTCGNRLSWIKEYSRYYCYKCKKYQ